MDFAPELREFSRVERPCRTAPARPARGSFGRGESRMAVIVKLSVGSFQPQDFGQRSPRCGLRRFFGDRHHAHTDQDLWYGVVIHR
jgi:hypothetical protein